MATVTSRELRASLSDVLNRVAYTGERVLIERNGRPVAALVSVADLRAMESRENAEDLADHRAAMAEAQEKGSIPFAEALAETDA